MHESKAPARAPTATVLLVLAAATFLLRFPFFFPAVFGWDESTFILIGQSMLDGHLPYAHLWDVKPPLLFASFSAAIAIFGHDLIGIRFYGALCVAATAFLVYLIAARWWTWPAAILAALLCVAGISFTDSGQATMSEHVMLPAFVGAVLLWTSSRPSGSAAFSTGALIAVATLIRLNLAIVVIVLGAGYLFRWREGGTRFFVSYGLGGLLVVALTCIPFLVAGEFPILWKSAVLAALERSNSENSALSSYSEQVRNALDAEPGDAGGTAGGSPISVFVWLASVPGLAVSWWLRRSHPEAWQGAIRIVVLAVATAVSILNSGGSHAHYLMQLTPFVALLGAALVQRDVARLRWGIWILVIGLAVPSLAPVAAEYRKWWGRVRAGQNPRYGAPYDIAAYLTRENPNRRPVYLLTDHLAYWLTRSYPPTRLAHPSSISKAYIQGALRVTPEQELRRVLDSLPEFVVVPPAPDFLGEYLERLLRERLAKDYVLAATIDGRSVYRRSSSAR